MEIFSSLMLYAGGEHDFVRPNLTVNGTMGGKHFAVLDNYFSYSWRAVDSGTGTYATGTVGQQGTYFFYNPKLLKATTLNFTFYARNNSLTGNSASYFKVLGLKENATFNTNINNSAIWENISITTYPTSRTESTSAILNNSKYYYYYAIFMTPYSTSKPIYLTDLGILGKEK